MEKHAEPICTEIVESQKCLKGNLVDIHIDLSLFNTLLENVY